MHRFLWATERCTDDTRYWRISAVLFSLICPCLTQRANRDVTMVQLGETCDSEQKWAGGDVVFYDTKQMVETNGGRWRRREG